MVSPTLYARPRCPRFDAQHLVAAQELLVVVADERAGQQVPPAQDLKPLQMPRTG